MDVAAENYTDYLGDCASRSLDVILEQITSAGQAAPSAEARSFAMHTLDYAFRLPGVWGQVRRFLLALGPKMEQAGHRSEWLTFLQLALEQSQMRGDLETEAELHYQRAILLRLLGRVGEADAAFRKSASLFEALGDSVALARTLGRHAFLCWMNRDLTQAEEQLERAETLLANHKVARDERAYCWLVRGALAMARQRWDESDAWFREARCLWEMTGNLRMQALCWMNQGAALTWMKRTAEAISVYEEARRIFDMLGDTSNWALTTMNIGYVYEMQKRQKDALRLYAEAETIFRKTGDRYRLAELYNNQGESLRTLERWQEAEEAYRLSIALWRELENHEGLTNSLDNLCAVQMRQGQRESARESLEEALKLLPTLPDSPRRRDLTRTLNAKRANLQTSA